MPRNQRGNSVRRSNQMQRLIFIDDDQAEIDAFRRIAVADMSARLFRGPRNPQSLGACQPHLLL
jgi:hypothetical protein